MDPKVFSDPTNIEKIKSDIVKALDGDREEPADPKEPLLWVTNDDLVTALAHKLDHEGQADVKLDPDSVKDLIVAMYETLETKLSDYLNDEGKGTLWEDLKGVYLFVDCDVCRMLMVEEQKQTPCEGFVHADCYTEHLEQCEDDRCKAELARLDSDEEDSEAIEKDQVKRHEDDWLESAFEDRISGGLEE